MIRNNLRSVWLLIIATLMSSVKCENAIVKSILLLKRGNDLIRQMSRLLVWFLVGVLTVSIAPVAIAPAAIAHLPIHQRTTSSPPQFISSSVQDTTAIPTSSPQTLFQQGLDHYQSEQFFDAIEQWNEAARLFAAQASESNQALALGYVSLGYQQLGQLDQAEAALTESLRFLGSPQDAPNDPGYAEIYAKVLNIQGTLHWHYGQLEAALTSWQEAGRFYADANQPRGLAIAQINQARALQALGLSRQAEAMLRQVYTTLQTQDASLQATGLRHLGSVLRQLGDLETAHTLLQESLSLAADVADSNRSLVELGNTEWSQGDRLQAIGRSDDAQRHWQSAQQYYQQAIDGDASDTSLEAQLNLLSLLIATDQSDAAIHQLLSLPPRLEHVPLSRRRINASINFTERWMQLADQFQVSRLSNLSYLDIAQFLSKTIQDAQSLNDQRVESYALGQLGRLYEQVGQDTDARRLTQEAQLKLEGIDAPEIQYRWEWQLGRIAKAKGDRPLALSHYEAAVSTLQAVRNNLLSINPEVQFSFRDNVEPVYREFVDLLLISGDADLQDTEIPSQQQLEKAIRAVDQLQLAELENYLGCAVARTGQIRALQDETAAILYPIVMGDRLAVITQLPGQSALTYRETIVAEDQVESLLQSLQINLSRPDRTPEVVEEAQQLYDWLLRPIEADLQQSAAQTLVFVPDGALRNVPMSVLFDGEQYLIEKGYAVAIAPRLNVFLPSSVSAQLQVKLGGVSIPQVLDETSFPPIEKVEEELERIAQFVEASPPLLNESFTVENIQQQLKQAPVSAIHWKTHGIFSSDPFETYIVGYNQRITASTLNELIGIGSQGGSQPLELLVLSACETAQGDNRAVLGLAGLAARTGTRSVLSTLWIALDTPNTEFMVKFYQSLVQDSTTKAEAVRQAQLSLINDYGYTTPYIWANYMLIGNWL